MLQEESNTHEREFLATSLLYHGDSLLEHGRDDEALACYIGCGDLARREGLHDINVQSIERRVNLHRRYGNQSLAERVVREGLNYCVSIDNYSSLLLFQRLLCSILRKKGETLLAMEMAFTGLELAQNENCHHEEMSFFQHLTAIARERGESREALDLAKGALRKAKNLSLENWSSLFRLEIERAES